MGGNYRLDHGGIFLESSSNFSEELNTSFRFHHGSSHYSVKPYYANGIYMDLNNPHPHHQYVSSDIMQMKVMALPVSPLSPQYSYQLSINNSDYGANNGVHKSSDGQLQCHSQESSKSIMAHQDILQSIQHPSLSNESPSSSAIASKGPAMEKSVKHILEEMESTLMGPDDDEEDLMVSSQSGWTQTLDELLHQSFHQGSHQNSQQSSYQGSHQNSQQSSYQGSHQNSHQTPHQTPHQTSQQNPHQNSHPNSHQSSQRRSTDTHNSSNVGQYGVVSLDPNRMSIPLILQTELGCYYLKRSPVEQMLVMCAAAIAEEKISLANDIMVKLKQAVSIYGNPSERLAAYMSEGLVARLASSGIGIYNLLKCKEAPAEEVLSAMQKMYEICPYFKFGHMAANGAIAEAFKGEAKVHIVDFHILHGTQWVFLIRALAERPGGPPSIRLTGIDDSLGGLQEVGDRLRKLAESVGVLFEFCPIGVSMGDVIASMIELRADEALAVNFAFHLHHLPDESVCLSNPRDQLLRVVKGMRPKVLTLVEHEANMNTAPFFPRFLEALDYYTAMFESIDIALPRESKERVSVEEQCLARDIVNIIACEGTERVERYELVGKWRARLTMAGFRSNPLSSYINSTIKGLLESYNEKYSLKEEGGALFLGWLHRPLVVASAWH